MTEQNTMTLVRAFAEIIERQVTRFEKQGAEHERKLAEHQASFAARTGADEKIIEGLRVQVQYYLGEIIRVNEAHGRTKVENDGLMVQVQDMRAEMERLRVDEREADLFRPKEIKIPPDLHLAELYQAGVVLRAEVAQLQSALNALQGKIREMAESLGKSLDERDALRAEVAALQERLRASIARGDFAQMEVAALKSQNPKQHPVKVGEWVRRTDAECDGIYFGRGVIAQVLDILDAPEQQYTVSRPEWNGYTVPWAMQYCEPCDPPQTEPVPKLTHPVAVGGYLRRLTGFNTTPAGEIARVTLVEYDDPLVYEVARPNGQTGRWSAKYCEPCDPPPANHDTEAGKAAAVAGLPVAEEIKAGDLVMVFQATGSMTDAEDIGCGGVVHRVDVFFVWLDRHYTMGLPREGVASLSDVRKVTT